MKGRQSQQEWPKSHRVFCFICSKTMWKDENRKKIYMIKPVSGNEASKNDNSFPSVTEKDEEIDFDEDIL